MSSHRTQKCDKDKAVATSTPNASRERLRNRSGTPVYTPDISILARPPSPPIIISDSCISDKSKPRKKSQTVSTLGKCHPSVVDICLCDTEYTQAPETREQGECTQEKECKARNRMEELERDLLKKCVSSGTFKVHDCLDAPETTHTLDFSRCSRKTSALDACCSNTNQKRTGRATCEPCDAVKLKTPLKDASRKSKKQKEASNVGLHSDDRSDEQTSVRKNKSFSETKHCDCQHQDSGGARSVGESASESLLPDTCGSARVEYYRDKLLATLSILENKEETVRVQAESLGIAEKRISALNGRAADLRKELDEKTKQICALQESLRNAETTDVATDAQIDEAKEHKDTLATLRDNLAIIEELYRDCFYETAKQEAMADMLRKSNLQARLMDKRRTEEIHELRSVIETQERYVNKCQELSAEMENLKVEIGDFLSDSNNDSGMWERGEESLAVEVNGDLRDIMQQLVLLRDMLTSGCICGLEKENRELKMRIETFERELKEMRQVLCSTERRLVNSETCEQQCKKLLEAKEKELQCARHQLRGAEERSRKCDNLNLQLQQVEATLNNRTEELKRAQQQSIEKDNIIRDLTARLEKTEAVYEENNKARCQLICVTEEAEALREQLNESREKIQIMDGKLQRCKADYCALRNCFSEKEKKEAELEAQLREANVGGSELCSETKRVVCTVRQWMRRMHEQHREQQDKIAEQEILICSLRERLQSETCARSETEKCCSKCCEMKRSIKSCPRASSTARCSKHTSRAPCRLEDGVSESEIASCTSIPSPPKRPTRKKYLCGNKHCEESGTNVTRRGAASREGSGVTANSSSSAREDHNTRHIRIIKPQRDVASIESIMERVEGLSESWLAGQRRWSRAPLSRTSNEATEVNSREGLS